MPGMVWRLFVEVVEWVYVPLWKGNNISLKTNWKKEISNGL
jgi:hypothetical protein